MYVYKYNLKVTKIHSTPIRGIFYLKWRSKAGDIIYIKEAKIIIITFQAKHDADIFGIVLTTHTYTNHRAGLN